MVSTIAGPVYDSSNPVNLPALAAWCRENYSEESFFGSWLDTETNKLYVDISENFYSYDAAMQLAHDNNQIAIWDVLNNHEIRTNA